MKHPLDGIYLKIARASEHLDTLDSELDDLFQSEPEQEILDHTFDGTWHVISVNPPFEELPLRLSIICGDLVHNLRSALDHLVWQLVLAEGNEPDRANSFPIYEKAKDFDKFVRSPKAPRRSPLHGINPNGQPWKLIEDAQPYRNRKYSLSPMGHPLAILKLLSNFDKHRTMHVQALFPSESTIWDAIEWNPEAKLLDYRIVPKPLSLENKTEIVWLRFSNTGAAPEVHLKGAITINPTFGDGTNQPTVGLIRNLHRSTIDFVNKFDRFF